MKITIEQANRIRFVYDVDNVIEAIRNALTEEPADAVIIDAYSDVFTGKDSKDATQTRQFLNEYGKIAKDFGCCVAFYIIQASEQKIWHRQKQRSRIAEL